MHDQIYTDGIGEIMVGGSIVRVDLVSLSPTERDTNNTPKKVFCQRVIFSIEGFANSVEVMQSALQGLVDAGVVKRNAPRVQPEPARAGATPESADHSQNPRLPNVSTNFR